MFQEESTTQESVLGHFYKGAQQLGKIVCGEMEKLSFDLRSLKSNENFPITPLQKQTLYRQFKENSSLNFFLDTMKLLFNLRRGRRPLNEELEMNKLWETLSLLMTHTLDKSAIVLLRPAVEAFVLFNSLNIKTEKNLRVLSPETQLTHIYKEVALSPEAPEAPEANLPSGTQILMKFAETHLTALNEILRQSTTIDGPLAELLLNYKNLLDFDLKSSYIHQELERINEDLQNQVIIIYVKRKFIFRDSYKSLYNLDSEDWRKTFHVIFKNNGKELNLYEWYEIILKNILHRKFKLFKTSTVHQVMYSRGFMSFNPDDIQPNAVHYVLINSLSCNEKQLMLFKFFGQVIAKAVCDYKLLRCYFPMSFYKHILGKSLSFQDMESEDPKFYNLMLRILEQDLKTLSEFVYNFSIVVQQDDVRDLKPNGNDILVTEETKKEYVQLVSQMIMTGAIREQLKYFLEGFYSILPKRLISIFNEQELELFFSGIPVINIENLEANAYYYDYHQDSSQIQWLWRALRSFDKVDRSNFLQFVMGTSKVPLHHRMIFAIHRDDRPTEQLPKADICFNRLYLPVYETYEKLCSMLLKAIR